MDISLITSTPTTDTGITIQPHRIQSESTSDDVSQSTNETYVTPVRDHVETSSGRENLQNYLGPLGQKYIRAFLSGDSNIDNVYGVYIENGGMMLGDKRFNVAIDDSVIINGVTYAGTPGLYELIFKKLPDANLYTIDDKRNYKHILLTTNVHRHGYNVKNQIKGNKGYKYKHIITPLLSIAEKKTKKFWKRIICTSRHDINRKQDRLRALERSQRVGEPSAIARSFASSGQ